MRRSIHFAATATLFALLARAADDPTPPLVGVYLSFDALPESVSVEVMKSAVERLLKPAGIALAWRMTAENSGKEAFAGLAVLRFKGRCLPTAPGPINGFGEINILATTDESHGQLLPYTDVECDQVRKALAYVPQRSRQRALGIALGRVVAHELYHILANTATHAAEGLAKASQLLPDLVSLRDLSLDGRSSQAVQNHLNNARTRREEQD